VVWESLCDLHRINERLAKAHTRKERQYVSQHIFPVHISSIVNLDFLRYERIGPGLLRRRYRLALLASTQTLHSLFSPVYEPEFL
jgi:hypothetical protein